MSNTLDYIFLPILILFKPGPPRTVDQTKAEIREQLHRAAEGSLAPVTAMQTASGIKDRVAQRWIEKVITQAKELKQEHPELSVKEVQQRTIQWLDTQTDDPWSPLLCFAGKVALSLLAY